MARGPDGQDVKIIMPNVGVTDERAARRLRRALEGRAPFRRFRAELHEEYPELVRAWNAFRDSRAKQRAVERLAENGSSPRT